MNDNVSVFVEIKRWFFWPWKKHPFIFFSIASLLAIFITVYSTREGPNVQQGLKLYFAKLAVLLHEIDGETHKENSEMRQEHLDMVRLYARNLTSQEYSDIVSFLYPTYRPKKVLANVAESLEKKDLDNNRKAILLASTQIRSISLSTLNKVSKKTFKQSVPQRIHEDQKKRIEHSIEESVRISDLFVSDPNYENARESCLACRRSILLLVLAWGYDDLDRIENFRKAVIKSRDMMLSLVNSGKYTGDKRSDLKSWRNSENFRLLIINKMVDRDTDAFVELLKETIETSTTE